MIRIATAMAIMVPLGAGLLATDPVSASEPAAYAKAERDARSFLLSLLKAKPDARLSIAESEVKRAGEGNAIDKRIMRVIATGAIARRTSSRQSIRRGYPKAMRAEIDALMKTNGDLAWVRTLDALWHLEVLRRAGGFGGSIIGASKSKGLASAERVLDSRDLDDGLGLAIAAGLAGHDPRQHKTMIARALAPALRSKEPAVRNAARRLRTLMSEDYGEAADFARALI